MTQDEILARILVLEQDVVKLQDRIKELYWQIREDSERAFSPLDNDTAV